jgi:hypothetical protein
MTAQGSHPGRFHTRRTAANHQHPLFRGGFEVGPFTLAPGRRVGQAGQVQLRPGAVGAALHACDAGANIIQAAFFDFIGQFGVRHQSARHNHKIGAAPFEDAFCKDRIFNAPDDKHRDLIHHRTDARSQIFQETDRHCHRRNHGRHCIGVVLPG